MPVFSFTLIQKIEAHSDRIVLQIVQEIRHDSRLEALWAFDDGELSRQARDLVGNLGHWLIARDPEVTRWSEDLGRVRFEQAVPLHALILSLAIVKARLIGFARDEMSGTVLQIYAEEELEHRVGRFFDEVLYHAAKGYESARSAPEVPGTGLKRHATHS